MVHEVSHRQIVHICQGPVPEKWENPLVEGIAPGVDGCLFEWITFAVGQGLEPDLTLILESNGRSCFDEGLSRIDAELLKLLGGCPFCDRACATDPKTNFLLPGICIPRYIPPELYVGRLFRKPRIRPVSPVNTENSVRSENTGVPTIREIMVATTMRSLFVACFALIASTFRTRAALQAEILARRHQLAVFQKNGPRRLRLHRCDRLLWVLWYRFWSGWRRCLAMVQPDTVIRWHRKAFAWHWTRKSCRLPGRPEVAANIRDLIRRMSQANPLWGAPRIHGELLKLGIAVAQSTVARYLPRPRKPPSQGWRTFLKNHLAQTAAIDFFTVSTATFRVLFVFVVLSHERRRVLHFGVTEHPTEEWTMQQMREAFPWDAAPRYVLRDRDGIYGRDFAAMIRHMGIEEVLTAPRSP